MSRSVAYLIKPDGDLDALAEFRNSHGFGPFVWNAIAAKYLDKEFGWMLNDSDKLWPLWRDMRLPKHWRAALLVTYDWAIIEQARFRDFAEHLRRFVMDVGVRDRACHLPEISMLLDKHAGDDSRGMCFYGTSLSDNLWRPWDYEKDEPLKYDFAAPGKHFYVGASLAESEQSASPPPAPSTPTPESQP